MIDEFTSLVPTWIIIFSGSFRRMGLTMSSMSSVVATGNGFTTTLLVLERLQPRMSWMNLLLLRLQAFLSVHCFHCFVLFPISFPCFVFFLYLFSTNNLPFFLIWTLVGSRTSHVVRFQYSLQFIV